MARSISAELSSGANLGAEGQNARLRVAVLALAVALFGSLALIRLDLDPAYRLATFFPFFLAAFCAIQGLFRTCPKHSRQGTREGAGGMALPHQGNLRCIQASKKLAVRVVALSLLVASLATGFVYLLPR